MYNILLCIIYTIHYYVYEAAIYITNEKKNRQQQCMYSSITIRTICVTITLSRSRGIKAFEIYFYSDYVGYTIVHRKLAVQWGRPC